MTTRYKLEHSSFFFFGFMVVRCMLSMMLGHYNDGVVDASDKIKNNNEMSLEKGSPGVVVKLLSCDHEVMGSSTGNSLLQKCRERLRTKDPKWSDPSPDLPRTLRKWELRAPGCPFSQSPSDSCAFYLTSTLNSI